MRLVSGWALARAGCSRAIAPAATVATKCRRGRLFGDALLGRFGIILTGHCSLFWIQVIAPGLFDSHKPATTVSNPSFGPRADTGGTTFISTRWPFVCTVSRQRMERGAQYQRISDKWRAWGLTAGIEGDDGSKDPTATLRYRGRQNRLQDPRPPVSVRRNRPLSFSALFEVPAHAGDVCGLR